MSLMFFKNRKELSMCILVNGDNFLQTNKYLKTNHPMNQEIYYQNVSQNTMKVTQMVIK
jgi:hypothetical protein